MSNNLNKIKNNKMNKQINDAPKESGRSHLSARAKNLLLPNKMIKDAIAKAMGTTYFSVHRWIQDDSPKIAHVDALRIIREFTGLTDEQILTQPQDKAA